MESSEGKIGLAEIKPLRDMIASSIRDAITDGRLKPGERLTEQELVTMLGVSRTPLREALLLLDSEGFVTMNPRRGAIVSALSIDDVTDIYGAKGILEAAAAKLACDQISNEAIEELEAINSEIESAMQSGKNNYRSILTLNAEFHQQLSNASGNKRLSQFIHNLRSQTLRYNYIYLSIQSHIGTSINEHKKIIEALRTRNKEEVERLIIQHNDTACKSLCSYIVQHSHDSERNNPTME